MDGFALVASLLAVLISGWALWRTEQARVTALRNAWDSATEARRPFWNSIEQAYGIFRADYSSEMPENLHALIGAAGLPPGVPVKPGHNIRNWAEDNADTLGTDQRHLWSLAVRVYSGSSPSQDTMHGSIIDSPLHGEFDAARKKLSRFFLRQHQVYGNKKLFEVAGHAKDDAVLLCWLELALHRSTRDPGEGNSELYSFARFALEPHAC